MVDDYENSIFTDAQLEEIFLFWLCATKSNFLDVGLNLRKFLAKWNNHGTLSPFKAIRNMVDKVNLPLEIKNFGIQDHNDKAIMFIMIAFSGLNLRTCTGEELGKIKGIKKKSINCFFVHTRHKVIENKNKNKSNDIKKEYEKFIKNNMKENKKAEEINEYKKDLIEIDLDLWNLFRRNKQ